MHVETHPTLAMLPKCAVVPFFVLHVRCVMRNKQGNATSKGRLYLLHICFNRWWAVAAVSPPLLCVDSYTHNIEAVSCDEALVDITEILTETRLTPDELANAIRDEIKAQTKCTASVGMGKSLTSFLSPLPAFFRCIRTMLYCHNSEVFLK